MSLVLYIRKVGSEVAASGARYDTYVFFVSEATHARLRVARTPLRNVEEFQPIVVWCRRSVTL